MTRRPSRRSVLRAGAVLPLIGLAGCTGEPEGPPPPPDPDVALRALAVERERALLEAYDAALAAAPALAGRLAPLRADHAEHLRLLVPPAPTASPSPSASPPAATPVEPGVALVGLRAVERSAAEEHAAGAVGASRELAGLLASLSACEASHAVALA